MHGRRRGPGPKRAFAFLADDAVAAAMRRFAFGSVLTLAVLILGVYLVGHWVARDQALQEAEDRVQRLSRTVGGLVTPGVRSGNPEALVPLEAVLRTRFEDGVLTRAKIWSPDGTILWSDRKELVEQQFPLPDEVRRLLGTREVYAEISALDGPENASERGAGELLEVYAGSFDAQGRPLLIEAYMTTEQMDTYKQAIVTAFIPLGVAGLVLFQAAVMALAVSMGRRVQRSEELRARATEQALRASELERKRVAQELHDGVVQDLAGVGFSLPALRRSLLRECHDAQAASTVERLEEIVHRNLTGLRSMMLAVYPPDLETTTLVDAIRQLVRTDQSPGLTVSVEVVGQLDLPRSCVQLIYRVAREGLHNVVKHAQAEHATVRLEQRLEAVVAQVCDDGVGIRLGAEPREDSLGLRVLTEAIEDAGGRLTLRSARGDGAHPGGTCLVAVVPLATPRRRPIQGFSKGVRPAFPGKLRSRGAWSTGGRRAADKVELST